MKLNHDMQCQALLDLATHNGGYFSTLEAHSICLKYTSRISDLRKRGWIIECIRQDSKNNTFHVIRHEAQQMQLYKPRTVERLIGEIAGMEWYEVVAA